MNKFLAKTLPLVGLATTLSFAANAQSAFDKSLKSEISILNMVQRTLQHSSKKQPAAYNNIGSADWFLLIQGASIPNNKNIEQKEYIVRIVGDNSQKNGHIEPNEIISTELDYYKLSSDGTIKVSTYVAERQKDGFHIYTARREMSGSMQGFAFKTEEIGKAADFQSCLNFLGKATDPKANWKPPHHKSVYNNWPTYKI